MTKVAVDAKETKEKRDRGDPVHHIGGKDLLLELAAQHGTPIFVIDHEKPPGELPSSSVTCRMCRSILQ